MPRASLHQMHAQRADACGPCTLSCASSCTNMAVPRRTPSREACACTCTWRVLTEPPAEDQTIDAQCNGVIPSARDRTYTASVEAAYAPRHMRAFHVTVAQPAIIPLPNTEGAHFVSKWGSRTAI